MKELVNLNNLQLLASNNKGNSSHRKLLGGKNVNEPIHSFSNFEFFKAPELFDISGTHFHT